MQRQIQFGSKGVAVVWDTFVVYDADVDFGSQLLNWQPLSSLFLEILQPEAILLCTRPQLTVVCIGILASLHQVFEQQMTEVDVATIVFLPQRFHLQTTECQSKNEIILHENCASPIKP